MHKPIRELKQKVMTKVTAKVEDGSLCSTDETRIIERGMGKEYEWVEKAQMRREAGNYLQTYYEVIVSFEEAKQMRQILDAYYD